MFQTEDIRLLTQIGFTETQAKLYWALLSIGQTDAKNLARQANVPRQAAYRSLGELQEKGLVERIISLPLEYKAVPLQDGLAIMTNIKAKQYAQMLQDTKEFLLKHEAQKEQATNEKEYNISIVEGRETILKKTKHTVDNTKTEVCICSTLQRWIHINSEIYENVEKALKRGIKYRAVLENANGKTLIPKEFEKIIAHPNYEIRVVQDQLKINAAIFDKKEASFSFYPSKALADSPMIWTNHPSLVVGFEDHFENLWNSSEKTDFKKKIK